VQKASNPQATPCTLSPATPMYGHASSNMARPLCLILIAFLLTQPGCHTKSEEQKILDSFQEKVNVDIHGHKITSDVSYKFDVEKTNSLASPYIGTATITFNQKPPYPLNAETKEIFEESLKLKNHKLTYAYQDSQWVLKLEECYADFNYIWGRCAEPIMNAP